MPPSRMRVAILCGGTSNERDVSIRSGIQVQQHLNKELYEAHLVEITATGHWMLREGRTPLTIDVSVPQERTAMISAPSTHPIQTLESFDVAFLALHGSFGEDGRIQSLLELLHIPYTGSGVLASALCMNKMRARSVVASLGIPVPKAITVHQRHLPTLDALHERIISDLGGYPCIVKPNQSGSSLGMTLLKRRDDLAQALEDALNEDGIVLLEEYVCGREFTCGVLGNASQGGALTALPPVEIIPAEEFFNYKAKYISEETQEICPARLIPEETERLKRISQRIHEGLGCDGLSRTDYLYRNGEFYFLETNTIPGLTEKSLCPKEAIASGMTFEDFLGKQIALALELTYARKNGSRHSHE